MFVTPLNFNQILDRFYNQSKYDFMLLFVSSFNNNDKNIIREIIDNAKRIDRITGDNIVFFYFIKDRYDEMNGKLLKWVRDISDDNELYGEGVNITIETADDICRNFGLYRSYLPAFILVNKSTKDQIHILTINNYSDFERFLTPLNILHAYIEDRDLIIYSYETKKKQILSEYYSERRKTIVTQQMVEMRAKQRISWMSVIKRQARKRDKEILLGEIEKAEKRGAVIQWAKEKLEKYPELRICGEDESIVFPQEELDRLNYPYDELNNIKLRAVENLNFSLNTHDGNSVIELTQSREGYSDAVLNIWSLVKTRKVRISGVLERIRREIRERGFDIFISCKSQDYAQAKDLYNFLSLNGFRPFLADTSIKEVGMDQYTALIGEVLNVCNNMIVFATNIEFLETPYVSAEWHTFINDINTGHKPNAKIVSILSPEIDPHNLPVWLRDKQCFTTHNYECDLIPFINDR